EGERSELRSSSLHTLAAFAGVGFASCFCGADVCDVCCCAVAVSEAPETTAAVTMTRKNCVVFMFSLAQPLLCNFMERQHLIRHRFLGVLNPTTVVINSVSAAAVDGEIRRPICSRRVARGIGNEDCAVELAVSAAVLNVCGESVADNQNDSVPARITVVSQVSSDDQNAGTRGAAADVQIAVYISDLRGYRGVGAS